MLSHSALNLTLLLFLFLLQTATGFGYTINSFTENREDYCDILLMIAGLSGRVDT